MCKCVHVILRFLQYLSYHFHVKCIRADIDARRWTGGGVTGTQDSCQARDDRSGRCSVSKKRIFDKMAGSFPDMFLITKTGKLNMMLNLTKWLLWRHLTRLWSTVLDSQQGIKVATSRNVKFQHFGDFQKRKLFLFWRLGCDAHKKNHRNMVNFSSEPILP